MKLRYTLPFIFSALLFSCNDSEILENNSGVSSENVQLSNMLEFPADDGAMELTGTDSEKAYKVLVAFDSNIKNAIYSQQDFLKPTEAQLAEIKDTADVIVKGCKTESEKYEKLFKWVYNNVAYNNSGEWVMNNAWDTFTKRLAVCQGYSELLNAMLYTQGITNIIANGKFNTGAAIAGHAWNYVKVDGTWYLSDPTNNISHQASQADNNYFPTDLSCYLWEDDNFIYNYNRGSINIYAIKNAAEQVVVPFSVNGYKVTKFKPIVLWINTGEVDGYGSPIYKSTTFENVVDLYIGKNITSIGSFEDNESIEITSVFPNLKNIYVDPENTEFTSSTGVLYTKEDNFYTIRVIAPKVERIELLPMEMIDKDCMIESLSELQVLVLNGFTTYIGTMSIFNCPKLYEIHIPEDCWVEDMAVYKNGDESNDWMPIDCNNTVNFVRFIPTSVDQIKY